jgi:ATP-dependent 26S proteasome regulatory subunit
MAATASPSEPAIEPYRSSLDHLQDELLRLEVLVRGQVARAREVSGDDAYRGLAISEPEVDQLLARPVATPAWDLAAAGPSLDDAHAIADLTALAIARRLARSTAPLRLAQLASRFGLSRFVLDVLVIALAPEIDLRYERLYAYLHDDVTRKRPSVDLALHLACRSLAARIAARAAFDGAAPLVHHRLVHVLADPAQPPLLARSLKVDDRVIDWLHGSDRLEPTLARHAHRTTPTRAIADLVVPTAVADRLARVARTPSILYLHGAPGVGKRTAAEAIARIQHRDVITVDLASVLALPDDAAEPIIRAAAREAQLVDALLCYEAADRVLTGDRPLSRAALLDVLVRAPLPIVLAGETAWDPSDTLRDRPVVRVEIPLPDAAAQERLWRDALAPDALAPDVELAALAGRIRLSGGQITDAVTTARGLARLRSDDAAPAIAMADLDEACRRHAWRRFGSLARRIPARPTWDDLVLPGDRIARLRELCDHARHRALVLERWGFDRKLPNGKGLGLLFTGAPGTGKTFAASVIAAELGLDLYQIDLASVVSKWIGETEKHLSKIFDEAERGHGVLLFDEADALFGKRSEIHDAHDRYANLETSYLLQRMEAYEGIVILASNFRRNLDEAFVRRLRFIIEFPLPDERERLRIWERIWPPEVPRAADVDLGYLARRFELAGAFIRNIALAASFLAAGDGQPVGQRHLLHAARREYQKIGKMIDESAFVMPRGGAR